MLPEPQNALSGTREALEGHCDRLRVIYSHLDATERSRGLEAALLEADRLASVIFAPITP